MASGSSSAPQVETNPRGIPRSPFIENVEEFLKDKQTDEVLRLLQENYSKYKIMEISLTKSKQNLKSKLPDIQRTLEMVKLLKSKKEENEELKTHFELADTVYASATIPPTDKVCLWLGANVMVEYDIDEAIELMTNNFESAMKNLQSITEDLDFLKDQITTTEVNIARVYNYDVKQRRKNKPSATS